MNRWKVHKIQKNQLMNETLIRTKRRLIGSYTLIMGAIMTVIVIVVSGYIWKVRRDGQMDTFQNNVNILADKLKGETIVTNDWLSNQESKNHMLIYIEDNGNPLKLHGSWMSVSERQLLFDEMDERSAADGLNIRIFPVSYTEVQTRYYTCKNSSGEDYYGSVSVIPYGKQYRSFILLQNFPENAFYRSRMIEIGIMVALAAWLLTLGGNAIFVGAVLKPVSESRRKQTEFIACASHELKAPLAVIQSSSSALLVNPKELTKYSDHIRGECRRMARLIDDMLLLASTETNQWKMKLEPVGIDTLLLEVFEAYEEICVKRGMKLKIELGADLSEPVMADEARLKQVIVILLENALQYSQSKEPLEIRKTESKNYLNLYVIDHGIGITADQLKHIFEKFYRGDASHKDKAHYGLGLSIAKELVRLQGGMLNYQDTPGGGATFVIKVPK